MSFINSLIAALVYVMCFAAGFWFNQIINKNGVAHWKNKVLKYEKALKAYKEHSGISILEEMK